MSTRNLFPTFNYSQPEVYRFSHDSVFLAREIFERHQHDIKKRDYQILDLCAGCGIVGMDLLFHQLQNSSFQGECDFLEVQMDYRDHFQKNKLTLQKSFEDQKLTINWIEKNYADIKEYKKYDLILANPPFFIKSQGALSNNKFKNRCRFFIDSTWTEMLYFTKNSLKKEGKAYFLVRDDLKKLIEREYYFDISLPQVRFVSQIRGTWIGCLESEP